MINIHSCHAPRCIRSRRLFGPKLLGWTALEISPRLTGFWLSVSPHLPLSFHLCLFIVRSVAPSFRPRLTQIPMQLPPLPPRLPIKTHHCSFSFYCFICVSSASDQQLWLCEMFFLSIMRQPANSQFVIIRWPQ